MSIEKFADEYRFLSNFYAVPIVIGDDVFPSVEHAYQAAKNPTDVHWRACLIAPTPGIAKRLGWRTKLRPDWHEIRAEVMFALLKQKFAKGSALAAKLLETGDEELVEGNYWHDVFYGQCNGTCSSGPHVPFGDNVLGELLMDVRAGLKR
jgi:hypothetical protein